MVTLRRVLVVILAWSLSVGVASGPVGAGTPQGQAPGRPYSGDCSVVLPQAQQLAKGLAVQEQAMQRTAALIAAAKAGTAQPAGAGAAVDSAKSVISSLLSEGALLRKKLEALQLGADASTSRARVLADLDKINVASNAVDVALAAGKYQQAMADVADLRQLAEATGGYLMDSGLADLLAGEVGKRVLGEAIGGPAGALIVQAAALGIDVGARLAEQEINANDVRQAQDTYDALKYQYDAIQSRIQFMVDNCQPAATSDAQPSAKSSPPPQPQSPAPTGKKSTRGGNTQAGSKAAGAALLIGLVAGAGAAAAVAVSNLSTTTTSSGCDTSKAPINEINTYCFGSSRNTTLCNQYIAQYDSFCKSCGFSGFDTSQGKCR